MIFQHSAVTSLTSWQAKETNGSMPVDIHPVYLGGGTVAFGLDATGMQGLDARVMEQPEVVSMWHMTTHLTDDLMICHAATLSKHYRIEYDNYASEVAVPWASSWGLLPAGYFDYALVIDGKRYETEDILQNAENWQRNFDPSTGTCTTSFKIGEVAINWLTTIAPESGLACFPLELSSVDGKEHTVEVEARVHLYTRRGEAIASGALRHKQLECCNVVQWEASDATSTAPLKEPYNFCWGITMDGANNHAWDGGVLSTQATISVSGAGSTQLGVGFFFGCSQSGTGTLEDAERELRAYHHDAPGAVAQAQEAWRHYFADSATFSIGDQQMEFVYHVNQYLLLAGVDWSRGHQGNYLWNQNFMGSTFWDSYFLVEGMLRAGHPEQVRLFIRWLAESALQQEGRPFYWIHYYDGEAWGDDVAYQVMAAHAGSAIRYYEYTHDRDALRQWVYPIVKRVSDYTRQHLIGQFDGLWRIKVIMSGDVCGDDSPGTEETGVLSWLVVAMAKAVEYGRLLGEDDDSLAPLAEVVESSLLNPYDWSQPVMWWSWLPYITGAEPFYDQKAWKLGITEALLGNGIAHMRFNDIGQPWGAFSAATSCLINGLPNPALSFIESGLHQVYGLGAFCEFRYDKNENAGNAPLPTASGSYLSAIGALFAQGTIWDEDIRVLVNLPSTWMSRRVHFANICTPNGARLSGDASPDGVALTIDTDRPRALTLGVPVRLWGMPLELTVSGSSVAIELSPDKRAVCFAVEAGHHIVRLLEDKETVFPVVLYEPKYRAHLFQQLLSDAGISSRLVRTPRALPALLTTARVLLLPSSMIQLPSMLVEAVESFVANGGCVVGLHHAGCREVNPRLAELFGVRALTDDRFAHDCTPATYRRAVAHILTNDLPEEFAVLMADRMPTPNLAEDVTVLYTQVETGAAVATLRSIGKKGGLAIWLAPGQETTGRKTSTYGIYDAIDILGQHADEQFTYPDLEATAIRELLLRVMHFGLAGRGTDPDCL